jgi:hypothetical protein
MKTRLIPPSILSNPHLSEECVPEPSAPKTRTYQTNPVPKTDTRCQPRIRPRLPEFRQRTGIAPSALTETPPDPPAQPRECPTQSITYEPSPGAGPIGARHAFLPGRNPFRHVTHLLLAAMDTLRPIGRPVGARAAFLLGARPTRRIERCGRLERCDVRRRKWRDTPRGDANRGGGICRHRRRNQTPAPESEEQR